LKRTWCLNPIALPRLCASANVVANFEHFANHPYNDDLGIEDFENTGWESHYEETNPNLFSNPELDLANCPPYNNWLVSEPFLYPQDFSNTTATNLFQQPLESPLNPYLAMGTTTEDNYIFPGITLSSMMV
jgi:hypothetical protein